MAKEYTKTWAVKFSGTAYGDGYWGMKPGCAVHFYELHLRFTDWEDEDDLPMFGEIQLSHDCNSRVKGMPYTDKGITEAVRDFLRSHPELKELVNAGATSGSEQGMQGQFVLSMDTNAHNEVDHDTLVQHGFDVEEIG